MKVKAVKINQICIFVLVQVFCSASPRKASKRGGVTRHYTYYASSVSSSQSYESSDYC